MYTSIMFHSGDGLVYSYQHGIRNGERSNCLSESVYGGCERGYFYYPVFYSVSFLFIAEPS